MEPEPLQRARLRFGEGPTPADRAALDAAVERAREALETLAERAAELEAAVPERLDRALQESMRAEVLPVGRHVAEVRGLANQTIRRLERLQVDLDAERRARVEDLAVLVDLVASGWRAAERRVGRVERVLARVERALEERPVAEVYRLEDRQERTA
ncbi:MAG: hypothetical protein ICV71_07495 [Thermoleophilia bacterium]|nr:hypothetical protein [Thermoleophilia bacterium]MDQ3859428.1 hypothetical protein [Actinomycetota bacterium]